jgi:hypothetical protein
LATESRTWCDTQRESPPSAGTITAVRARPAPAPHPPHTLLGCPGQLLQRPAGTVGQFTSRLAHRPSGRTTPTLRPRPSRSSSREPASRPASTDRLGGHPFAVSRAASHAAAGRRTPGRLRAIGASAGITPAAAPSDPCPRPRRCRTSPARRRTRGVTTRAIQTIVEAAVGQGHSVVLAEEAGEQTGLEWRGRSQPV